MNKQQHFIISHKQPVLEQDFLNHLNKICEDKYLKRLILSYYKKLKTFDHKYGKQLSTKSYGVVPFPSIYGDNVPDQAKYLFGAKKHQQNLVDVVVKYCDSICDIAEKTPITKKTIPLFVSLRNAYLQNFLQKHSNQKIGKADLFRWQFVNFIDKTKTSPQEETRLRGSINFILKELTFNPCQSSETPNTPDEHAETYYTDKTTVFHELTHLMSLKSFENGNYKYLFTWELEDCAGLNTALPNFLAECPNQEKVASIFSSGLELLNELATESATAFFISDITSAKCEMFFEFFENCPAIQSVHLAPVKDKCYVVHSEYQFFGHFLELIMCFENQPEKKIISPDRVPTETIHEIVEEFFTNSKVSPALENALNQRLAKKIKATPALFKNANNFHKFVLLLGIIYQQFDASILDTRYFEKTNNLNSAYNLDSMLLQAVVLDIHKNKFLEVFTKPEFQKNTQDFNPKKVKQFLANYAKFATVADDWIIKPNTKSKNQDDLLRKTSTNLQLSTTATNNLALKAWSNFLKTILATTQEFAPEILNENLFLQKEKNYIKNQENNLEK